jgi:hypothetical protein
MITLLFLVQPLSVKFCLLIFFFPGKFFDDLNPIFYQARKVICQKLVLGRLKPFKENCSLRLARSCFYCKVQETYRQNCHLLSVNRVADKSF